MAILPASGTFPVSSELHSGQQCTAHVSLTWLTLWEAWLSQEEEVWWKASWFRQHYLLTACHLKKVKQKHYKYKSKYLLILFGKFVLSANGNMRTLLCIKHHHRLIINNVLLLFFSDFGEETAIKWVCNIISYFSSPENMRWRRNTNPDKRVIPKIRKGVMYVCDIHL